MPVLRLDKIIADSGLCSRREVRCLVRAGKVLVDGIPANSADTKYDTDAVHITVDGEIIDYSLYRYYMMNKPQGVVCATEDRRETTVLTLLDERTRRLGLFPVGRLDKDTEGLLLLTNDGDFAHRVISPKSEIVKRYYARVRGLLSEEDGVRLRAGVTLADGTRCLPAVLTILSAGEESACTVDVSEGKYHQVKRMLASLGKPVVFLKRLSIGGLELDETLETGQWRELKPDEIRKISEDLSISGQ